MKKSKFVVAFVLVAAMVAMCMSLVACGVPKTSGIYYSSNLTNSGVSESYKLELFEDGTYELMYQHSWSISAVALTYGRNVTSYGKFTVSAEDAELQTKTVALELPTRIVMSAFHRNGTLVTVDTDNWPAGNAAEEIPAGISYTLMERAETETWEAADVFLTAFGRAYTIECDNAKGGMTVTVVGEQINTGGAVTVAE